MCRNAELTAKDEVEHFPPPKMITLDEPVVIGRNGVTCELHNCDCLPFMRELPDKAFDLAIVDPPYGIEANHNMGRRRGDRPSDYKKIEWDNAAPGLEYFSELFRISANQIIWGANHFVDKIARPSSCWIVWDKLFSNDVSFAAVELAWTSFTSVCKKFTGHPLQNGRIHPTQKPVALYSWLLANYAEPGQTIFDSHLGSGSHAIACLNHGYNLTACELDSSYFNAAVARIQREANQGVML